MDERGVLGGGKAEVDGALIVLKYELRRVLMRLLFPTLFAGLLWFIVVFIWAPGSMPRFVTVLSRVFGTLFFLVILWYAVDMIFMKHFGLYHDRAVKTYRLLGCREVLLSEARMEINLSSMAKTITVTPHGNWVTRLAGSLFFDCSLGQDESLRQFTAECSQLGMEFQRCLGGFRVVPADFTRRETE
ncbi:MAG TPA: hypothetical protein VGJ94_18205 [Syntrophorhabdaceae bacterium]|jgi:hypothetical protein